MTIKALAKALALAGALTAVASAAVAAVVGISPGADLGAGDFTIDLGGASYAFGNSGVRDGFFGNFLPSVRTGGTATVSSLTFFTPVQPSTYFTDVGRQPFVDEFLLGSYVAYEAPVAINAITDSFVALRFELGDGVHFGFARLAGLTLFDFAYETVAGTGVLAVPGPYAPIPGPAPIPLPAGMPLLAAGLGALALVARRRA